MVSAYSKEVRQRGKKNVHRNEEDIINNDFKGEEKKDKVTRKEREIVE
jgi:hypothetical protein